MDGRTGRHPIDDLCRCAGSRGRQCGLEGAAKAGAQFQRDEANPERPIIGVEITNPATSDADLARLKAFPHLQRLTAVGKFTNAGLAHLAVLTDLETLQLASRRITDTGVAHSNHWSSCNCYVFTAPD